MANSESASTFAKGLRVLDCFESGRRDLTMADIARQCGFDRATARRLCLALMEAGYVVQTGRTLRLTARALAPGAGYLASHDYGRAVQPILDRFAGELDGEIALAVLDGARAIYVARSATAAARVSLGLSVGSPLPLAPTAVGRAILAQLPPEAAAARLAEAPPRRFTDRTETDPAAILAHVAQTAADGHCHLADEFETGAAALAVPAGLVGGVPAALGTTGTVNALKDADRRGRALDVLRRTALSLGFRRAADAAEEPGGP